MHSFVQFVKPPFPFFLHNAFHCFFFFFFFWFSRAFGEKTLSRDEDAQEAKGPLLCFPCVYDWGSQKLEPPKNKQIGGGHWEGEAEGRGWAGGGGWWPQIGVLVSTSVGRFSNPDPVFTVKTGWHG